MEQFLTLQMFTTTIDMSGVVIIVVLGHAYQVCIVNQIVTHKVNS